MQTDGAMQNLLASIFHPLEAPVKFPSLNKTSVTIADFVSAIVCVLYHALLH